MNVPVNPVLRVDIWSDIICPFCWIGKRRFEAGLKTFAHADKVEVVHHAFRLSPGQAPTPVDQMLQRKYGMSPSQVAQNQTKVTEMAAGVGLEYHLEGTISGDTVKAHRLVKFAAEQGLSEIMLERLYRAYFTEGQSLFDDDTLIRLAVEAGLEAEGVKAFLATDTYTSEVKADQDFITSRGANGVPFFVFNQRYAVSGAQETVAFTRTLEAAWAELPKPLIVTEGGPVCDDGVCAV